MDAGTAPDGRIRPAIARGAPHRRAGGVRDLRHPRHGLRPRAHRTGLSRHGCCRHGPRGLFGPRLRFHRAILAATGNDFLIAFGATVEAALRMSFELSTLNPGAPRNSLPYHRAILDQIWARNPEGARRAMHELMNLTERNIVSALSRRRNADAPSAMARRSDR